MLFLSRNIPHCATSAALTIITTHTTIPEIDAACSHIVDDLDSTNLSSHLVVGFDAEWNVDMVKGGGAKPTSIVQIAYNKPVFVLQVGQLLPLSL